MKPGWDPYAAALAALDEWERIHGGWPTKELIQCARTNRELIQAGNRLAETVSVLNAAPKTHTQGSVNVTLTQERMIEAASAAGQWERLIRELQQ